MARPVPCTGRFAQGALDHGMHLGLRHWRDAGRARLVAGDCQESCVRGHSDADGRAHMAIKKDTLDGLLAGRDPQAVFAKDGLFDELKKALAERVLNAEIDFHLDGEAAAGKRNSRNGYSKKRVLTETSKLDLRIPRDREGTFDPKLIARYQRRFPGFDEKIVSMYARGMTFARSRGVCSSFMAWRSRPISFRR
jgi:hypothetical protein